jgi:predicted ferric reductase
MAAKLATWSLMLLFPLPLMLLLNAQLDDAGSMRFFISLGLLAYAWWLLAILLSVRVRWVDRAVGLPTIYAFHGVLGVLALVPAFLHRENTFAPSNLVRLLGDWAFWVALGVLIWSVLFMSGWITDRLPFARRARTVLETIVKRRLTVWIHRLNLVVVGLIWLHVHLIDRLTQHLAFMVLFDAYTVVVLGIYVWKKWVAPDSYRSGTVVESAPLNGSTHAVAITVDGGSPASRPGDFYFLRFDHPGLSSEAHPFSALDDSTDVLRFTIRAVGDDTRRLAELPTGTTVRIEGPYGRFDRIVRNHDRDAPLVLVGMGAGVAPLLSLIAQYAPHRRIHLLWSVRTAADDYHGDLLEQHAERSGGRLTVTRQVGRFRREQLEHELDDHLRETGAFFVVGPNAAVLHQQRQLRRLGVHRRRIHHERLTM